ncbi:hypothetical protein [Pectobacterium aquaticum]|uniref:hypothetical protein n=1 Tax=Pectobacterium aquaticum TaxID=2204145 RepID=UPI000E26B32C|nr:hypothetical protein [Pectobacterium aquaticum]UEM40975.1 hypothetical protein DMB82_0008440 [Pectobacterium aquaticum]
MEKKIIPFEYCSLERAAKFFSCEEDDFFHWQSIGKINISFYLDDMESTILSINGERIETSSPLITKTTEIEEIAHNNYFDYNDKNSNFCASDLELDSISNVYRIKGYASGLWIPCQDSINVMGRGSSLHDDFWLKPYYSDVEFRIMIKINDKKHADDEYSIASSRRISKKSLILYKDDLLKIDNILNGKGDINETKPNSKTANSMAKFIKSLIAINYGVQVAESPRKYLEDTDSSISRAFQEKGISIPSGKTVSAWLKDVDIDRY